MTAPTDPSAFLSPAFAADPFPAYARLREAQPVHRLTLPNGIPAWLVTRYDEARAALGDPRLSKAPGTDEQQVGLPADIQNALSRHLLTTDPPDHTRLRRLVSRVFTLRQVENLRPRIEELTGELLDRLAGRDEVDLVDALTFPLPIQVIFELLGIPASDRERFRAWSNVVVANTIVAGDDSAGDLLEAASAMVAYIRNLLPAKRETPDDRLLSAMLAVRDGEDGLTDDELISMVFLLLVAGHETTVNLLGSAAFRILTRPGLREQLIDDSALLASAVDEFLRYDSPLETSTLRVATQEMTLGGATVAAGEVVLISLLSANRDQRRFTDPDTFDPRRADNQHLAFGHGIHYCLGAPLARAEAQIGLGMLLRRHPKMTLTVEPTTVTWRPGLLLRGPVTLPVRPN